MTLPTEILGTKISQLTLSRMEQYNPPDVFEAILKSKQMQFAEGALGLSRVITLGGSRKVPDNSRFHLRAALRDITVENILDEVARTWAGRIVVIYGVCAKPTGAKAHRPFIFDTAGQI